MILPGAADAPVGGTRVLGVDTSLRSTGVGVVEARGSRLQLVEFAVLRMPAKAALSECLCILHQRIAEIIDRTAPVAVAVEGIFFCRNMKTALTLGEARGAVIATCAARRLPVYEYAPRRIKQAIVGFGGAEKDQVGRMVSTILGLSEAPPEDAADALAIAICHLNSAGRHALLAPEPI